MNQSALGKPVLRIDLGAIGVETKEGLDQFLKLHPNAANSPRLREGILHLQAKLQNGGQA